MEPQATPEVETPQTVPKTPAPQIKNSLVLIMSILLMLTVGIAGLFYFQIQKLSKELSKYQVSTSPTPTTATDPTADWKTYTDKEGEFILKYPNDWEILSLGGPVMIAPIANIQDANKIKDGGNIISGKNIISILHVLTGVENAVVSSNEYVNTTKIASQIDNITADKYESIYIKDTPNREYKNGDITIEIVIPLSSGRLINYSLVDQKYLQTFNEIISTFKFMEATPSANPIP